MSDPSIDIRDRRGRLARLALATAIGAAITTLVVVVFLATTTSTETSADPISRASQFIMLVLVFLGATLGTHALINRLRRRR